MTKNVILQIICLPATEAIPVGYHRYERPGRPNTRASSKKFEYYVKVQDIVMSAPTSPDLQSVKHSDLEELANFLGTHMNLTSVQRNEVKPIVVDVEIMESDITDLFSRLSTKDRGIE